VATTSGRWGDDRAAQTEASYGSACAAHTTPAQSPEKDFPLWEAKFVNPVTGISFGGVAPWLGS